MTTSNHITKVAIVGASGNVGSYMTSELLKTGKHTVTAITRQDSQSQPPEGVNVAKVDYASHESIVAALRGQQALIITLGGFAPDDLQKKIIDGAVEAGVAWILPNEWSPDTDNEDINKDVPVFQTKPALRKYALEKGQSSYIFISTGFWYEWSLAIPSAFGFDIQNKSVTLFDQGDTKISISTWPQVGRAVASLLSLPIKPEGSGEGSLQDLANKFVYVVSFTISQNDMFDSILRVTGGTRVEWNVTKESSHERYATGVREMGEGKKAGFAKMMYTRVFYPDGSGDIEHKGTINGLLRLPPDDMDRATERAIERSKGPVWGS